MAVKATDPRCTPDSKEGEESFPKTIVTSLSRALGGGENRNIYQPPFVSGGNRGVYVSRNVVEKRAFAIVGVDVDLPGGRATSPLFRG